MLESKNNKPAYVIAVASGKGGVGKTCLTANLGMVLISKGSRVCVFDADTGLANINIMLRLQPRYSFTDVLTGDKSLPEVITEGPGGLNIITAGGGIKGKTELDLYQKLVLKENLEQLQKQYDYLLLDLAAGIGDTVLTLLQAIPTVLLVVTAEPTSLTDAFSVLKLLKQSNSTPQIQVVVNQVENDKLAAQVFKRFSSVVKKFLDYPIEFLGAVPADNTVNEAISIQKPLMDYAPDSNAYLAMRGIADKLAKKRYQANGPVLFKNLVDPKPKQESIQKTVSDISEEIEAKKPTSDSNQQQQNILEDDPIPTIEAADNLQSSVRKMHLTEMKQQVEFGEQRKDSVMVSAKTTTTSSDKNSHEDELLTSIRIAAMYGDLYSE